MENKRDNQQNLMMVDIKKIYRQKAESDGWVENIVGIKPNWQGQ